MSSTARPLTALLLILLAGAGLLTYALPGSTGVGQRLVQATVSVDGKVVLRASTSDDGHPDADAVWGYLHRLEFRPTEAFAELGIDPDAGSATLGWLRSRENAHLGDPPDLELDVSYGGLDRPFRLTLVPGTDGETWRVDPATIEGRFPYRRITRAQAAQLDDPERTR